MALKARPPPAKRGASIGPSKEGGGQEKAHSASLGLRGNVTDMRSVVQGRAILYLIKRTLTMTRRSAV